MIAPSVRWCRSAARTHSGRFPSIARLQGIFSLPTLESLSITEPLVNSLNRVAHLEPTSSFGTSNEDFQSYHVALLSRWNCESHLLRSYPVPLVQSLGDLSLERVFAL
jgi:hypothetical protein